MKWLKRLESYLKRSLCDDCQEECAENDFNIMKRRLDELDPSGDARWLRVLPGLHDMGDYLKGECVWCKGVYTLTVSKKKQIFYCFDCHVSGDIVAFFAKRNHCSQYDALEKIEEFYF